MIHLEDSALAAGASVFVSGDSRFALSGVAALGASVAGLSSSGVGGNNHLAGALFAEAAGIQLTHVPYKGTGPALADVISGQITMNFSSLPPAVGQIKGGNLKALAVTGERRVKSLPGVPTLKEQGIDVVVNGWHGLFAPAKTPDAILDKIDKDAKQAMKDPTWEEALAKDGLELPPERTRVQFAKFVADGMPSGARSSRRSISIWSDVFRRTFSSGRTARRNCACRLLVA